MRKEMAINFTPGRVREVVETITRYVPEEAPSLEIDEKHEYSVRVRGSVTGIDRIQRSGTGKPVARVGSKKSTILERLRATITAYASFSRSGGIDEEEINKVIDTYNEDIGRFEEVTKSYSRDPVSENVLTTEEAAAGLARRL